jgi:hypothetical protein
MTETIVGVTACSKSKQGEPDSNESYRAESLYDSWLFDGRIKALKANCDRYCIFSAKHGYVEPDEELEYYDCEINELPPTDRRRRAEDVANNIKDADEVMILMGRKYAKPLKKALPQGTDIHDPLEGVGLFKQRAKLEELADGWTPDNQATLTEGWIK